MALIPGMVVPTIVPTLASSVAIFKLAADTFALMDVTLASTAFELSALSILVLT